MKWFLIILAIGLTTSDKLDRTYLPPPGAQFAGGHAGDIQAPLELPHLPHSSILPTRPALSVHQAFEPNAQPFQTPVTTTSYAFTQTTYAPVEAYQTTTLPINPITGLPIQNLGLPNYGQYNENLPDHTPIQGVDFLPQVSDKFVNIGSPSYDHHGNLPANQYLDRKIVGNGNQIPEYGAQEQQYPGLEPDNAQYYSGNLASPGATDQTSITGHEGPELNQNLQQHTTDQPVSEFQGGQLSNRPHHGISTYNEPGNIYNQMGIQETVPGHVSQENNSAKVTNTENNRQNAEPFMEQVDQNERDYNKGVINSFTHGFPTSTSMYVSTAPNNRPERPQAAADRNAVILNYENVRTPTGYLYSYDTSNGIHSDENGSVGDGTRVQGSYSYIGDDGKIYRVVYTADENGFQPRGDHLPTPPPIPEAIQKVIEQAAKDEAAGIFDDGSYDEAKYGYKAPGKLRRPQIPGGDNMVNNKYSNVQNGAIKPVTGITEDEIEEVVTHKQQTDHKKLNKNRNSPTKKENSYQLSNDKGVGGDGTITDFNKRISDTNNYGLGNGLNEDVSSMTRLDNNKDDISINKHVNQHEKFDSVEQRTPERKLVVVQATPNQYPDSQIEDVDKKNNNSDIYDNTESKFGDDKGQDYISQISTKPNENYPTITNRDKDLQQKEESDSRPGFAADKYIKENRFEFDHIYDKEIVGDVIHPSFNAENTQLFDGNGYHYNPPHAPFGVNKFPSRFKGQDSPAPTKPSYHKTFEKNTTVRPFLTPEIYNQPKDKLQGNNPQTSQGLRKPFMTPSVTTPDGISYNDYDDDYSTEQKVNDKGISPIRNSGAQPNYSTRKPFNSTPNTPRPHHLQPGHKIHVTPKNTVVSNNLRRPTTSSPSQASRFSTTEIYGKPVKTQNQKQPALTTGKTGSQPALTTPSFLQQPGLVRSGYRSEPTVSTARYPTTTSVPSYSPSNQIKSDYGSRLPSSRRGPTQRYQSSTTTKPEFLIPSRDYQAEPRGSGYQYEPVRSDYSITMRPRVTENVGSIPSSGPNYVQNPVEHLQLADNPRNRLGTFILSGPEATTPASLPNGDYKISHHYLPTTPGYANAAESSSPLPELGLRSGSSTPSVTSVPIYSTTASPSTIGTTIGPYVPTTITSGLSYPGYSSTLPSYSDAQGPYNQTPVVDGFGRPIITDENPVYSSPGQMKYQYPGQYLGIPGSLPTDSNDSTFGGPSYGAQQRPGYTGYYGEPQIIGEDFSGPRQPQKFDPQTGYHYK